MLLKNVRSGGGGTWACSSQRHGVVERARPDGPLSRPLAYRAANRVASGRSVRRPARYLVRFGSQMGANWKLGHEGCMSARLWWCMWLANLRDSLQVRLLPSAVI